MGRQGQYGCTIVQVYTAGAVGARGAASLPEWVRGCEKLCKFMCVKKCLKNRRFPCLKISKEPTLSSSVVVLPHVCVKISLKNR
jgi:hypothetical protein